MNDRKIKTITTTIHLLALEHRAATELSEQSHVDSQQEFDTHGNLVLNITNGVGTPEEEREERVFDEKNRVVEYKRYLLGNEMADHITYEYGENDLPKLEKLHYLDGSFDITEYAYDEVNNLTKKVISDDDGEVEAMEEYKTTDGRPIERISRDGNGENVDRTVWEYDGNGNEIKEEVMSNDNNLESSILRNFDESNRLMKLAHSDGAVTTVTDFTYEGDRRVAEKDFDEEGNALREATLNYDENGLLIERQEKAFDSGSMVSERHFRSTYEYAFHE